MADTGFAAIPPASSFSTDLCLNLNLRILASVVARNSYYRIVKQFYSIRIICQIVRLICQIVPIISLVVFSGRQERPMAFSQFIQRRRTVKSVDSNMSSSRLPDLWEIFSFVDSDKSEMIDETELRHAMRMMGFELNDQEVWDIFRWMDRDCDGLIGFEEFVAAIVNQERREENF